VRLLQAASLADNVDAEVEYAIALYNGTGTPKNEAAAVALLRKAAKQNSPIAQNRLARVLVSGQGAPMDKIEGLKWHLVAKTAGRGDPLLAGAHGLKSEDRAKAEVAARNGSRQMIRLDPPQPQGTLLSLSPTGRGRR
jgi:TPR repeat protein